MSRPFRLCDVRRAPTLSLALAAAIGGCSSPAPNEHGPGAAGQAGAGGASGASGASPGTIGNSGGRDAKDQTPAKFELQPEAHAVWVEPNATATLHVKIVRSATFSGPVKLTVSELPVGVSAAPVTVAAGSDAAQIELVCTNEIDPGVVVTAQLRGSAGLDLAKLPLTVGVRATRGTLDTSFGAGVVSLPDTDRAIQKIIVLEDGSILGVGTSGHIPKEAHVYHDIDFLVSKLQPDGVLDPSFGGGSPMTFDIGGFRDEARALAVDSSGRILVAGAAFDDQDGTTADKMPRPGHSNFAVIRLLANGTLDTSFAQGGKFKFDASGNGADDVATGVLITPTGLIYLAGYRFVAQDIKSIVLMQLSADGVPVSTFGQSGVAYVTPSGENEVTAAHFQGTSLLLSGRSGTNATDSTISRLTADGTLDASFGKKGWAVTNPGDQNSYNRTSAEDFALDSQGRIIAACSGFDNSLHSLRFDPNGKLDSTYGENGNATIHLSTMGSSSLAYAVTVGLDDSIFIGGSTTWTAAGSRPGDSVALAHFGADGVPDPEFGTAGFIQLRLSSGVPPYEYDHSNDVVRAMAVQPDGRILFAGSLETSAGRRAFVARMWQ